jgi:ribose-phosphate pyrophosphokinase
VVFDGALFAPGFGREFGASVADRLGTSLSPLEERDFEGGEHKCRPLVSVRGRATYVIASLAGDRTMSANDKLCRVLFLVGALREASAGSVTVVLPYLCYSRKDRQTKARDPVTTRYVMQLFEAVGTERVMTLDVHNLAAFQNAARCATDHLEAATLFVDHVRRLAVGDPLAVVSPDVGGVKRADRLRQLLAAELGTHVELAFTEKYRSRGVLSGRDALLGDVAGRVVVVYDDMISSGGTMLRAAQLLADRGARSIHLAATHGLFTPDAAGLFRSPAVASVVVTDSVPQDRLPPDELDGKLQVLPVDGLIAAGLTIVDAGGSMTELLRLEE